MSSKSSKENKRSSKKGGGDIEDPESEQTGLLDDSAAASFDTRQLGEEIDDSGGQVHSSMAKVKVISLRE